MLTRSDINHPYDSWDIFCQEFIFYLCRRCCPPKYHKNIISKMPKQRHASVHHDGFIFNCMSPKCRIDDNELEIFFSNMEHGLFHGICTAYISWLICQQDSKLRNYTYEVLLMSCVLHGFTKSVKNDMLELRNIYDFLHPSAYNPQENDILTKADRVELRRYTLNGNTQYETMQLLDDELQQIITFFYAFIRPALSYFYACRDRLFVRHGIENQSHKNFNKSDRYPPLGSYATMNWADINDHPSAIKGVYQVTNQDTLTAYPIEVDRMPFGIVSDENKFIFQTLSHCSAHDNLCHFSKLRGYLDAAEFKLRGGKIYISQKRDHLYANSDIKLQYWKFTYQGIPYHHEQVQLLIKNKIIVIPQSNLINFWNLVKLLKDRLLILNQ